MINKMHNHSGLILREVWFTTLFPQIQPVFSEAALRLGESEIWLFWQILHDLKIFHMISE